MLERLIYKVSNLYTHAMYAAKSRVTAAVLPRVTERLEDAPIIDSWVEAGKPKATARILAKSGDGGLRMGVWHCTAGTFKWQFFEDEIVYIIDGHVDVEHDGQKLSLGPGSAVYFPIGSVTRWTIREHVYKFFVHRDPALYTKKIVDALVA